jgi:hypothetical protein
LSSCCLNAIRTFERCLKEFSAFIFRVKQSYENCMTLKEKVLLPSARRTVDYQSTRRNIP